MRTYTDKITKLIEAFGTTIGEHILIVRNDFGKRSGIASMYLNWKCDMYYDMQFNDEQDLWENRIVPICKECDIDIEYGNFEVTYRFIYEDDTPADDDIYQDETYGSFGKECFAFQIQSLLYDEHEEELEKYNLDVQVLAYKKINTVTPEETK